MYKFYLFSFFLLSAFVTSALATSVLPPRQVAGLIEIEFVESFSDRESIVYIATPIEHLGCPFIRMKVSRTSSDENNDVVFEIITTTKDDQAIGYLYGHNAEIALWVVEVKYSSVDAKLKKIPGCAENFVSAMKIEHNKKRNGLDGFDESPIR